MRSDRPRNRIPLWGAVAAVLGVGAFIASTLQAFAFSPPAWVVLALTATVYVAIARMTHPTTTPQPITAKQKENEREARESLRALIDKQATPEFPRATDNPPELLS